MFNLLRQLNKIWAPPFCIITIVTHCAVFFFFFFFVKKNSQVTFFNLLKTFFNILKRHTELSFFSGYSLSGVQVIYSLLILWSQRAEEGELIPHCSTTVREGIDIGVYTNLFGLVLIIRMSCTLQHKCRHNSTMWCTIYFLWNRCQYKSNAQAVLCYLAF